MVKKYNSAFTMIELLVVVSIISIFMVIGIDALKGQLAKGRDSKRKADLNKIQNALEDYLNDNDCYPDKSDYPNGFGCGDPFTPYLTNIPCDPIKNTPGNYFYSVDTPDNSGCKKWYKIYTKLENINDPVIGKVGCAAGCGPSGYYNFWVSSPNMNKVETDRELLWWPEIGGGTQGTGQATPTPISANSPTPTSGIQATLTPIPTNPPATLTPTPSTDGCSSGCGWATAFFGGVCGQDCDYNTEKCVFKNFQPKCCYNESCVMP